MAFAEIKCTCQNRFLFFTCWELFRNIYIIEKLAYIGMKFVSSHATFQPANYWLIPPVSRHCLANKQTVTSGYDQDVQAKINENIKATRHWPLWGDPPVTSGFCSQRARNAEIVPFDGVIMQSKLFLLSMPWNLFPDFGTWKPQSDNDSRLVDNR